MKQRETKTSRKRPVNKVPEIEVDLDAPAAERWEEPAGKIAGQIDDLTETLLGEARELTLPLLPPVLRQIVLGLLANKASISGLLATPFIANWLRPIYTECKGIERATGVPASVLAALNCAYDYFQYTAASEPSACSCAVFLDSENRPVLLRFMDWRFPETISKYTVITHYYRNGEIAYSAVGFAGFLGVVTAVGPEWAVALNQAPAGKVTKQFVGHPACYAMRLACDEAESFDELEEAISESSPMTPFLALACGTEPDEVVRIEKPDAANACISRPGKNQPMLALSNHYLHRQCRKFNSDTEWVDEEGQEWMSNTHERLQGVYDLAMNACGCEQLPALDTFRVDPVCNDATAHLALLQPATNTLKLKNFLPRAKRTLRES